ncbi:MAG TPA: hypothetical protein P5161_00465 [Eubacteriales bacterium]|nr:hypothetical protein [Eubacteriales bacterium]
MDYRKQEELNNTPIIYDDLPVSRPVPVMRPETTIQMPAIVQPIALSPMVTLQESVVLRQADASELSSAHDYQPKVEDETSQNIKKQRTKVRFAGFFVMLFSLVFLVPFILPLMSLDLSFELSGYTLSFVYAGEYDVIGVITDIINEGFSIDALKENIVSVMIAGVALFAIVNVFVGLVDLIGGGGKNKKPAVYPVCAFLLLLVIGAVFLFKYIGLDALGIEAAADIVTLITADGMAIALLAGTSLIALIVSIIAIAVARRRSY